MSITARLAELDIVLPPPMRTGGLPFQLVRVNGNRALVAGHVPLDGEGRMAKPLGKVGAKVGADVTPEQGHAAARLCALAMLASLQAELGSLDRIERWLRVFGMVNAAPGFNALPAVINGCSEVLIEVFGESIGGHARSAIGVAELPFGAPVEIEAEVAIRD
jgi:enamine deaminase RidA (YjgF/YER057c/UK114 family)